jgi:hypothetical protein
MNVESVAIAGLVQDPANARKHGEKNLDAIKGSLARFGQQKPIVVNKENVIIAGNGTLLAAKALGWEHINIVRTELSGADLVAYGLADNKTAELADWDAVVLDKLLLGLHEEMFDITSIGFNFEDVKLPAAENPWENQAAVGGETIEEKESFDGVSSRILLVFEKDEYEATLGKAKEAMEKLQIDDMSTLFVRLLDDYLRG